MHSIPKRHHGFTLIELMVVVVIAAILLSIAVPTYMNQVRKSRRTEAKTALLDLAARQERFNSVANQYTTLASDLGWAAVGTAWGMTVGSGYYTVNLAANATSFTFTATAATTDQLKDTACRTFSVNQLGVRSATNSAGATSAAITTDCWR